ncbi:efflux RND transporter periplasmic adaptor subunit [Edaphobacter modestus]|uniref:Multidrug efflux system membrane fusion protein n=1 Tax=Edaphobacter modestus TaxID=388466 RepID=A0A4V2G4A5_9BACT|nr:HlyD family efflux transporter periplasmic adaptor subunit [Edaphobacter modestus]RZU40186.1 multidrug efflux system membrane fusion protein [Edaphobacter modestus]
MSASEPTATASRKRLGRIVSAAIIACALITGLLVINQTNRFPRTDDAEVFANFIGIAPQVDGPIVQLPVQDNIFIKQGGLLFEIDPRPYEYALERAKSDMNTLEGQIVDQRRTIASQVSAVDAAHAGVGSAAANVNRAAAAVNEAKANVANARAALDRANAELLYQSNNFHRIEPLLAKQFVTVDQIDQARTAVTAREQAVQQQRSQLALAEAQVQSAQAAYEQATAAMQQSHAQLGQSQHSVLTIDPLTAQREGRASAIRTAEYNLNNSKVYAPFDARVTNLTISQGAYAHTGQQVFTLIDTRTWWVIANFRETQLRHIHPGMHADVYVLSRPSIRYDGIVDSIGYGVQPDTTLVGSFASGLPNVQRSLNWVHLATRFPVRVRINAGESEPFRLSESAVVVMRGDERER